MTPTVGGTIDSGFFSRYDATVQAAMNSGSNPYIILDLVSIAPGIISCLDFFSSITMLAGMAKLLVREAQLMINMPVFGLSSPPSIRTIRELS